MIVELESGGFIWEKKIPKWIIHIDSFQWGREFIWPIHKNAMRKFPVRVSMDIQ